MINRFGTALAGFCVATALAMTQAQAANQIVMDLKCGPVVIDLRADLAPKHVRQITTLATDGFYDGIVFHRVIDGFMAQTGDPTGTGTGGSDLPDIPAEFSAEPFVRGTVGMVDLISPESASCELMGHISDQGGRGKRGAPTCHCNQHQLPLLQHDYEPQREQQQQVHFLG